MATFPVIVTRSGATPHLVWALLALTGAAIAFVLYHLARHQHHHNKAKKLGHVRHHDGRHGNH